MTSIEITVELCMSHRLREHQGKCQNLHGHNYVLTVEVSGPLDERGMVMDFGELKKIVHQEVEESFDHATALEVMDPLVDHLRGQKLYVMHCYPTAEHLLPLMVSFIDAALPNTHQVCKARLSETSGCAALYRNPGTVEKVG